MRRAGGCSALARTRMCAITTSTRPDTAEIALAQAKEIIRQAQQRAAPMDDLDDDDDRRSLRSVGPPPSELTRGTGREVCPKCHRDPTKLRTCPADATPHAPWHCGLVLGDQGLGRGHGFESVPRMTPLHTACLRSDTGTDTAERIVDWLIKLGADVNAVACGGITPIHLAVANGRAGVVDLLLKARCEVNKDTDEACNVLHLAYDSPEIMRLLLREPSNTGTLGGLLRRGTNVRAAVPA